MKFELMLKTLCYLHINEITNYYVQDTVNNIMNFPTVLQDGMYELLLDYYNY